MKRLALLPILLGLVVAPVAYGGATEARAPRAVVAGCDRVDQTAAFEGKMDTIPDADRMQMRFVLQVSTPDEPRWSRVSVPGFSAWVTSEQERSRYVYTKRVESLLAPASYRVKLRFRWLDADGEVLKSARATSRACRQPDPRADLRVVDLLALRLKAGSRRYDVVVRNSGRADAPASEVRLELADGTVLLGRVPPIAPGDREDVFLSGPACAPGDELTATADADDEVDERDEDGNTVTFRCPSA
jgi:hypothetical protein